MLNLRNTNTNGVAGIKTKTAIANEIASSSNRHNEKNKSTNLVQGIFHQPQINYKSKQGFRKTIDIKDINCIM